MQILVNTDKLRSTASKLEGIVSDLSEKRNNLIRLQSNLDYSIRYTRNINQTIVSLSSRLYEAQCDLNRIKTFLNTTANKYETTEETINRAFDRMCELTGCNVNEPNSNTIQGNGESDTKWYEKEWVKWLGGVALGAGAVACCVWGGPILAIAGAAAIGGGVVTGLANMIGAEDKSEAFIDGFLSGGVGAGVATGLTAVGCPPMVAGAISSGGSAVFMNLLEGKPFYENVIQSMAIGGATGGIGDKFFDPIKKEAAFLLNKLSSSLMNSSVGTIVGNGTKEFIINCPEWVFNAIQKPIAFNSNSYIPDTELIPILCAPVTNFITGDIEEIVENVVGAAVYTFIPSNGDNSFIKDNSSLTALSKTTLSIKLGKVGESILRGANAISGFDLITNL